MADAREIPDAIQWHEGMMLAPQHFQQLDLRVESLRRFHNDLISPFHWGVLRMETDRSLLVDKRFRLLRLEAVLPDGLAVFYDADAEEPVEIDLTPLDDEIKAGPLPVHLIVPESRSQAQGAMSRYRSVEGAPVPDESAPDSRVSLPRLVPRLGLLATHTPPRKYTSMPLARVAYINETLGMTPYIPPTPRVTRGGDLWNLCAPVARKLREKAVFLAEKLKSPGSDTGGAAVIETRLLIESIVANLTRFEAVLNTGVTHPFAVYMELCGLVGGMAALSGGLVPPVLSAYDHDDLRASYEEAIGFINRIVDETIIESHTGIPFQNAGGVFSLLITPRWLSDEMVIGLRGKARASEDMLERWLAESLIGSASVIDGLQNRRILGAKRRRIASDGDLIPLRGMALFKVTAAGTGSGDTFVHADEELKIFCSSEAMKVHEPVEVILYVRN